MSSVQIPSFTVTCPGLHPLLLTSLLLLFFFLLLPLLLTSLSAHTVLKRKALGVQYMLVWPCLSQTHNTAFLIFFLCPSQRSKRIHFVCKQADIPHQYYGKTLSVLPAPVSLCCFSPHLLVFPLQIVRDLLSYFRL